MIKKQLKFEDKILNGYIFKTIKTKFLRFQGHFDLEDRGQGQQFSNSSETFMCSLYVSSLKAKFKTTEKLLRSQGITHTTRQMTTEPKTMFLPVGGGET